MWRWDCRMSQQLWLVLGRVHLFGIRFINIVCGVIAWNVTHVFELFLLYRVPNGARFVIARFIRFGGHDIFVRHDFFLFPKLFQELLFVAFDSKRLARYFSHNFSVIRNDFRFNLFVRLFFRTFFVFFHLFFDLFDARQCWRLRHVCAVRNFDLFLRFLTNKKVYRCILNNFFDFCQIFELFVALALLSVQPWRTLHNRRLADFVVLDGRRICKLW